MRLQGYELEEQLFSSGPSAFFRARNQILGNLVIVRRLDVDPGRADDVRETFFREQRHMAAIGHPRVNTPLDVMEEDGYLWSVHSWRQVRPTTAIIEQSGPFPLAEAARIGAQIADLLTDMHARGFLVGKLQPAWVVLDERGDTLVTNFVKSADLAAGIWPLREAVLGLSPYSAPEEFAGVRPTDRSDVYALAASFLNWITGVLPHGGKDPQQAIERVRAGKRVAHLAERFPRLSRVLADALEAALHPDPEQRHGSAAALGSLFTELKNREAAEIPAGFESGVFLRPVGIDESVEIIGRHGAGQFGVVLEARSRQGDRPVAVKALKPEHRDDKESSERFVREANALSGIRHPNVIRIRGVGREHGTPYVVMDFVPGPDLGTILLRRGVLEPRRAAFLTLQIARGLEAIHREGIVHRDLKPHNVLVGEGDRAVIADFGVARSSGMTRMTMTGNVVGTPLYMAPEQVFGKEVTQATDLYALGAILYEMVNGAPPFASAGGMELFAALRSTPPDPLPADVPQPLASLALHLLAKEPTDRPEDASRVVERLETYLA